MNKQSTEYVVALPGIQFCFHHSPGLYEEEGGSSKGDLCLGNVGGVWIGLDTPTL